MMACPSIACAQCGQTHSIHRLWCERCGHALADQVTEQDAVEDPHVTRRAILYENVLTDLEDLRKDQAVGDQTYQTIKTCYGNQLSHINRCAAARTRRLAVGKLIALARRAAHESRFDEAIDTFRRAVENDRGEHQLELSIAEIRERVEQLEQARRAAEEAATLYRDAKQNVDSARLDDALDQLRRAKELDPQNGRIIAKLQEVSAHITQRETRRQADRKRAEDEARVARAAQSQVAPASQRVDSSTKVTQKIAESSNGRTASREPITASFAEENDHVPSQTQRLVEAASNWSSFVKPFLLDNVGWFVGAFLVVAGFIVLIVTFWGTIEQNRILMHSLVYVSLGLATGMFFLAAYFMRLKYPRLESSSNVLLVVVSLLIPLVFAAALLTSLIPAAALDVVMLPSPR